jgi:hypothetical protein
VAFVLVSSSELERLKGVAAEKFIEATSSTSEV